MEKITLTKLIAEADKRKNKPAETKELFIKRLGGTITIQKPDRALCLDAMDMGADGDPYLVMEGVVEPKLKDPELAKAYGCNTPMEAIAIIFDPGEVANIAKAIVEFAGFGEDAVTAVDNLKN